MYPFRIYLRLGLLLIGALLLRPLNLSSQLIKTTDPVPSEAQIMMHLESMMGTWEVETALQKQGEQDRSGVVPVPDLKSDKLALQLRMVEGDMDFHPGPRVRAFIHRFIREKRKETEALLGLTQAYSPLVEHQVDHLNLPRNLRFLPAALSAYNTLAVSDRGHSGLWQLPYHAALRYGLDCGPQIDERRDPVLATTAALNYISDLKQQFGSWHLTVLAYTCGPANVNKALRRANNASEFEYLYDYLPAYGRDYWPAFVAMSYLGQYYRYHQLQPLKVELPIQRETVPVEKQLPFKTISESLKIPTKRLQALNPTFRGDVVCLKGPTGKVCLPVDYVARFKAQEEALYAKAATEEPPIASEPEVEVKNNGKPNTSTNTSTTPPPVKKKDPVPPNSVVVNYTIQPGDNLGRIAETYGVRVSQLQAWNGISGTRINAGDQLKVYVPKSKAGQFQKKQVQKAPKTVSTPQPKVVNKGKVRSYTVKSGDTLWGIAQQFEGVSAEDIMATNKISADIQPGQVLQIPAGK